MLQANATGGLVLAEMHSTFSVSRIVRFDDFGTDLTSLPLSDWFLVDMGIMPRAVNAGGCYPGHWNAHRFEPLGHVYVIPPGEELRVCSDGGPPHTSIVCHLHPQLVQAGSERGLQWDSEQLEASLDLNHRYIQSLLFRLAGEVGHPQFASDRLVDNLTAQLGIEVARFFAQTLNTKAHSGGLAPWRLRLIDDRVAKAGAPPTLAELAAMCKLSIRQLTRAFKTSRGCSVGDYIAESRIDQAKRLLMADRNIRSIATTLGYSSSASFSSAFRRVTGKSPRAFRQRAPLSLEAGFGSRFPDERN
jgi:AraC family transcriptional regulator